VVTKQVWAKGIARGNKKKSIRNIKEIVEKGQRVENGFKEDEKKKVTTQRRVWIHRVVTSGSERQFKGIRFILVLG